MKILALSAAVAALTASSIAVAAPTYYANRTAFDTANPGLVFEGFENMSASGTVGMTTPLNSSSNIPGIVTPGQIVSGIDFSLTSGNDAYVAAPGQSANTTRAIGVNWPTTAGWKVSFASAVGAFGVDIFQNFGGGAQSGSPIDVTVSLYDVSSALIGSSLVSVPSGTYGFFGVSSMVGISYLTIDNPTSFDVIDNVEFGRTAAVPEPGSMALFMAGLAGLGFVARRRKPA